MRGGDWRWSERGPARKGKGEGGRGEGKEKKGKGREGREKEDDGGWRAKRGRDESRRRRRLRPPSSGDSPAVDWVCPTAPRAAREPISTRSRLRGHGSRRRSWKIHHDQGRQSRQATPFRLTAPVEPQRASSAEQQPSPPAHLRAPARPRRPSPDRARPRRRSVARCRRLPCGPIVRAGVGPKRLGRGRIGRARR